MLPSTHHHVLIIHTLWKRGDELMRIGQLGCSDDFLSQDLLVDVARH